MHIPIGTPRRWQVALQKLAATSPGSWLLARLLPPLDLWVLRRSQGRHTLAALLTALPVVTLTSWGARSGLPRRCPLVAIPDGARLALIASNFGGRRHPAWVYNLQAHPQADVAHGGQSARYRARPASGEERARYWAQAVSLYAGYAAYARRAGREIQIFVLEPEGGA
jgi:deazaflavin-dependent oxidoreductase (nitroreductase family)